MGIVNVTPDSFSDSGLFFDTEAAVAHGLALLDEGADLLDLGAESTRPGSRAGSQAESQTENPRGAAGPAEAPVVSTDEEQARLLPVLEGILRARPQAVISVDTYKAATARAALQAGAEIINDVSGFVWDREMASVCAEAGRASGSFPGLILMAKAAAAGIPSESIVLDPGYGFGKRFEENYALLARQAELLELGLPLLAGLSRKSFLGRTLAPLHQGCGAPVDAPIEARETASVAALVAAILHGASIVRVHAVRPAVEAARIADAVLAAGSSVD